MTGIGTTKGTKETRTTTTNSSANIFPKSRKLSDNGFVKSSKMLIGKRIGVGLILHFSLSSLNDNYQLIINYYTALLNFQVKSFLAEGENNHIAIECPYLIQLCFYS